jgi:hypothetical protein
MQKKTQRQPDKFAEQCAIREFESNVIKYIMTDISSKQVCLGIHKTTTVKRGNLEEAIQFTFVKQITRE